MERPNNNLYIQQISNNNSVTQIAQAQSQSTSKNQIPGPLPQ